MDNLGLQIGGGIVGGGAVLIWFAKFMAGRLIRQYDDKHKEHDKELKEISKEIAVLTHIATELGADINAAHCKIRNIEKKEN